MIPEVKPTKIAKINPATVTANKIRTILIPSAIGYGSSFLISAGKPTETQPTAQTIPSTLFEVRDETFTLTRLGTRVSDNVLIQGGTYRDLNGQIQQLDNIYIPDALINVSIAKNIVMSQPVRSQRTVKQWTSTSDYAINIEFTCWDFNQAPLDRINSIRRTAEAPVVLPIISRYLQSHDIHYIVINNFSDAQVKDKPFEYTCNIQGYSDANDDILGIQ